MALPQPDLKLKQDQNQLKVWDIVRRKWYTMTPEEEVRQAMVHYLGHHLHVPINWMAVEKQILVFGQKRRFDLVVYLDGHIPWILIECKAPQVAIGAAVFDQIARYNFALQVPYLVVTNGAEIFCAHINNENQQISWLEEIPWPQKG